MIEKLVRQFLYYPTKLAENQPPPYYAGNAEEVWIDCDDGNRIHGLYWPASEGRPTILFFHGNAQSVYEWCLIMGELAPAECGLLLVDYPGYGKSTGEPNEQALYAAGRGCLTWLEEQGIGLGDIVIQGKSLGGGVTAEIAQGLALRGVIFESTFRSVPAVVSRLLPFLPADAQFKSESYNSIDKIGNIIAPVLVIHGTNDELIPVEEGKALFDKANEPKQLYLVEGAGHNDVSMVAGESYGRTIKQWLDG